MLPVGAVRVGGFGGVAGLSEWLVANGIEAVVDATHPFAGTISANAAVATRALGLPLVHLRRPGWRAGPDDRWIRVPDLTAAAKTVAEQGERVFLTIGRQGVAAFADLRRPWFLIRAIDPPADALPPRHELLLARGPFTLGEEARLLARHRIDLLVTKDSGGAPTAAKLVAARAAGVPVVVIERPPLPEGAVALETVAQVWEWLRARRSAVE